MSEHRRGSRSQDGTTVCTRGSSERHSAHTGSGSAPWAALARLVQREAGMSGAAFTPSRAQAFGTWEPGSEQSSAHLGAHLDRVYLSLSCRDGHRCLRGSSESILRFAEGSFGLSGALRLSYPAQGSHAPSASSLTLGQDGCVSDKLICSFQGVFLMNLSVFTDH